MLHLFYHLTYVFLPLDSTVDCFHASADVVGGPQNLCERYPSLFLCQSVQLLEGILQLSHSGQFPKELFYA